MTKSQQDYRPNFSKFTVPVTIVICAATAVFCIQEFGVSLTKPTLDVASIVALANLLIYAWLRTFSKFEIARQITVGSIFLATQLLFVACVRIDGFDGNGSFVLAYRWNPTPEEVLSKFESGSENENKRAAIVKIESDVLEFRGHGRDGCYQSDAFVSSLEFRFEKLWQRPIGRGWSSFIVVGDYCFTQEQIEDSESVSCFELLTGKLVWRFLQPVRFDETTSGPGPRATPAYDEGRIYALGATGKLNCLDAVDGSEIWTRNLCPSGEAPILFGYSGSPLVHDDKVVVTLGHPAKSIVAVEKINGKTAWQDGDRKGGYSSPQRMVLDDGRTVVLNFDAFGLNGHEFDTGRLLFQFPWGDNSDEQVNVSQPAVISADSILVSSGYGRGTARLRLQDDSSENMVIQAVWRSARLRSKFSSMVVADRIAIGLDDGILACIDLNSGDRLWKKGRFGHGQLALVNQDVLVVQAENGRLVLLRVDRIGYEKIVELPALDGRTWNHPIIAGPIILTRNDREAVCYRIQGTQFTNVPLNTMSK